MRIDYEPITIATEKVLKVHEAYILLHEDVIVKRHNYEAEYRDDLESYDWKPVHKNNTFTLKRAMVCGTDIYWDVINDAWAVTICFTHADDMVQLFDNRRKAWAMFRALFVYIYGFEYSELKF